MPYYEEMKRCLLCGQLFERLSPNKKFCSESCRRKWWDENRVQQSYVCLNCGKSFRPKRSDRISYCSRECAFEDYHKWHRGGGLEIREKVCPACGKHFETCSLSQRYCSAECSSKGVAHECAICGGAFYGPLNAQYCSDDCRTEGRRRQAYEFDKAKFEADVRSVRCKECHKVFVPEYGSKRRAFCSDGCSKRFGRRIGRAVRRAHEYSTSVERIDPLRVLRNYRWQCYLCGVPTPKKLRGTLADSAPEVDHIVPLAQGGTHTYDNLACCCRKCNQEKSDLLPGDYLESLDIGVGLQMALI